MEATGCKLSLRAVRVNAGYTLHEWSGLLDVSTATISRWERGICKIPATQIRKMCDLGGISESMVYMDSIKIRKDK